MSNKAKTVYIKKNCTHSRPVRGRCQEQRVWPALYQYGYLFRIGTAPIKEPLYAKLAHRQPPERSCVLYSCLESLPLYSWHRACFLPSSNPQPRYRRSRMRLPRANRPRNNRPRRSHQIQALRLPRVSPLRPPRSRLRRSRRRMNPGNKRRRLPKPARIRKWRHGRSLMPLALEIKQSPEPWRSACWG